MLINTEIGSEGELLKDLRKVAEVQDAYAVYGVYGIAAKVKANTVDKLKEILTHKVRSVNKNSSTLTMIVVEEGLATK